MKIVSINNFTTKHLSKLLSDLSTIGVHLKIVFDTKKFGSKVNNRQYLKICENFTKKFGNKVINRQYFHRKTGPC